MKTLEERVSLDQFLRLIIVEADDGDISIGLDGSFWHTHPELLVPEFGISREVATQAYLEYLTSDKPVFVIRRDAGVVTAIFPTDDPTSEFQYKPPEEQLEFRHWSGEKIIVLPS